MPLKHYILSVIRQNRQSAVMKLVARLCQRCFSSMAKRGVL